MTISFDDSVTAANLPVGQKHGVYYVDGKFANRTAVRNRLPNATLLGITVFGAIGKTVQIIDCENGDATPAQAERWVATQLGLGVYRPGVYANESTWNGGLKASLEKYGTRIKRWLALYDNVAEVPVGYDAKQYSDPGPVDKNVALDTFFDTVAPAKPTPAPKPAAAANTGVIRFEGSLDLVTETFTVHVYRVLSTGKREIAQTYKAVFEVDVAPGLADVVRIHRAT